MNRHEINKTRIHNYMNKKRANISQRVDMPSGGQYLDNFLVDFAIWIRNETINEIVTDLKLKREL